MTSPVKKSNQNVKHQVYIININLRKHFVILTINKTITNRYKNICEFTHLL